MLQSEQEARSAEPQSRSSVVDDWAQRVENLQQQLEESEGARNQLQQAVQGLVVALRTGRPLVIDAGPEQRAPSGDVSERSTTVPLSASLSMRRSAK